MENENALNALAVAVGYPERVPPGATDFAFSVDGGVVTALVMAGRVVLVRELAAPSAVDLARLACYAAGRALREEAVLAYDPVGDRVILWQAIPSDADATVLRRFFEVFAASCDWWLARVSDSESAETVPEMVIRP